MDIFPTILDIADIDVPNDRIIDGFSLKNTLINHDSSQRKSVLFYRQREIYAARLNDFKAHFITQGAYEYNVSKYYNAKNYVAKNKKKVLNTPMLFNLNEDPSEKYDVADENPEIIEKIKDLIQKHKEDLDPPSDLLSKRVGN